MSTETTELAALIQELQAQELRLIFDRFSNSDAWDLGSVLVNLARQRGLPIVIDIRRAGQQLFHAAMEGTVVDNDCWVVRKANTVDRFGRSSFLMGRQLQANGGALDQSKGLDPINFAAHGGSFPIRIKDVGLVGTVTVSGLPQAQDHALVVEAIGLFLS